MTKDAVLPGEHPHSDRPNWRPAETVDEYFLNVREGLEKPSIERLTKLLDLNRTMSWRARQMAHIPAGLFDRLLRGLRGGVHGEGLGITERPWAVRSFSQGPPG